MTTKEHPILFSTEMVKAILEDRKTMTRRVVKPQLYPIIEESYRVNGKVALNTLDYEIPCPYGQVSDRLWVRETLQQSNIGTPTRYKVDGCPVFCNGVTPSKWGWTLPVLSSIFMPRWASRITLEITNLKVESLLDITEADAVKEGFTKRIYFLNYWDKLNIRRGYASEFNPLVWVIEFKKVKS